MRVPVSIALLALLALAGPSLAAKPLPDLVVTKVTKPAHAVGGSTITIRDTILNKGKGSARSSVTALYLSFDKKFDDKDIKLEPDHALGRLRAGKTMVTATRIVVPTYLTGLFEVIACTDSKNQVKEAREGNNCSAAKTPLNISLPQRD